MKIFQKIRKLYFVLGLVLIVMAVLVAVSLRIVFSAITKAGEIDNNLLNSTAPRLDKNLIDKAIESVENRDYAPLDL